MKALVVVGLTVLALLAPTVSAQTTACTIRVDLRWYSPSDRVTVQYTGQVLTDPSSVLLHNMLSQRVGEIYWQETTKNKYPHICLDKEHADYFVVWTSGLRHNVPRSVSIGARASVFPRSESGCLLIQNLFQTDKFSKDEERSAKQAFEETLVFLGMHIKQSAPLGTSCLSIEDALKWLGPAEQQPDEAASSSALPAPPHGAPADATLNISSTPSGADIELDGSFAGSTPSSLGVSVGEHTITITKSGYKSWQRKITARSGTISVAAELEQRTAPASQPQ